MGKFFADRSVIKEMDCQFYNENNMIWFVDFDKEGNVVGFASIQKKKDKSYLDNFYVIPSHRGQGIGRQLLNEIIQEFDNIHLISRNDIAINMFKKVGFIEYGQNGRYKKMCKANKEVENEKAS